MKTVEAAVIGTGWCGGIRAETLSRSALCDKLHICEIRPDRLAEVKALTRPATATLDYQDIVRNDNISVVYISTTPESNHYPIARDCLRAGKNVLLEKPISLELWEADELIMLAKRNNLKFTIGYSQRFNTKIAYAKKKIVDGTLGKVVSVLVSRHLSRSLGKKIASRVRLSPAAMESTHDLDMVFWLLEPAKPVSVYSQGAYGYMQPVNGSYDIMWSTVKMDNGVLVAIGGGWNLPPSYPNYCATTIEITGTGNDLKMELDYASTQPGAYPIVLVTYEIACSRGSAKAAAIKGFLSYTASQGGQQALAELGYAPLPEEVRAKVETAVQAIS